MWSWLSERRTSRLPHQDAGLFTLLQRCWDTSLFPSSRQPLRLRPLGAGWRFGPRSVYAGLPSRRAHASGLSGAAHWQGKKSHCSIRHTHPTGSSNILPSPVPWTLSTVLLQPPFPASSAMSTTLLTRHASSPLPVAPMSCTGSFSSAQATSPAG